MDNHHVTWRGPLFAFIYLTALGLLAVAAFIALSRAAGWPHAVDPERYAFVAGYLAVNGLVLFAFAETKRHGPFHTASGAILDTCVWMLTIATTFIDLSVGAAGLKSSASVGLSFLLIGIISLMICGCLASLRTREVLAVEAESIEPSDVLLDFGVIHPRETVRDGMVGALHAAPFFAGGAVLFTVGADTWTVLTKVLFSDATTVLATAGTIFVGKIRVPEYAIFVLVIGVCLVIAFSIWQLVQAWRQARLLAKRPDYNRDLNQEERIYVARGIQALYEALELAKKWRWLIFFAIAIVPFVLIGFAALGTSLCEHLAAPLQAIRTQGTAWHLYLQSLEVTIAFEATSALALTWSAFQMFARIAPHGAARLVLSAYGETRLRDYAKLLVDSVRLGKLDTRAPFDLDDLFIRSIRRLDAPAYSSAFAAAVGMAFFLHFDLNDYTLFTDSFIEYTDDYWTSHVTRIGYRAADHVSISCWIGVEKHKKIEQVIYLVVLPGDRTRDLWPRKIGGATLDDLGHVDDALVAAHVSFRFPPLAENSQRPGFEQECLDKLQKKYSAADFARVRKILHADDALAAQKEAPSLRKGPLWSGLAVAG